MTDLVPSLDGAELRNGSPITGRPSTLHGAAVNWGLPSRTIAEAVRSAVSLPHQEGALLLMELTLAGGPWDSAAVARRQPSGVWGTWVGTGPLGQLCDQLQWELHEGPAGDALTTDEVSAPDLTADRRWPAWRSEAVPLGARAALAVRLHAGRTLGSVTVYADRPVVPDRAAVDHLHTMAAHLSTLLDAADRVGNLDWAMRSRGTIGQAIGRLAERYGIGADQAFATLRRISQNGNVKIADLAALMVETGDLPGLHPRGGQDGRSNPGGLEPGLERN